MSIGEFSGNPRIVTLVSPFLEVTLGLEVGIPSVWMMIKEWWLVNQPLKHGELGLPGCLEQQKTCKIGG